MKKKYTLGIWIFILLFFISIPLFYNCLFCIGDGHDLPFHLMRIEGLAEGLRTGQFPVKIQPVWYRGYGYGCSVFYGDLFLYIPAVLRIFGLSVQQAYKIYIFLIHMGTVGISVYSFRGIFKDVRIAVFGTTLFALSFYRLMNIYVRHAVGEYTAMMFLPLIAYAMVLILDRDSEDSDLKKGSFLLTLGMTGILQSHLLSAEMVCIILGVLCLVFVRRIFRKKVFCSLVAAVGFTVLLNLGFLVPLLDYMLTGKFNVNAINGGWRIEQNIQKLGVPFENLGRIFYSVGGDRDIGAGFSLILVLLVFLYLVLKSKKEARAGRFWKYAGIFCGISLLSLWMSTCFFPWEMLRKSNAVIRYAVINLQFPWRFLTIASVSLVLLWCSVSKLNVPEIKYIRAAVILLTFLTAGSFMAEVVKEGIPFQPDFSKEEETMVKSGEEYLPVNTVSEELKEENLYMDDRLEVGDWKKEGVNIQFSCCNRGTDESVMELPLLYYKGYNAEGTSKESIQEKLDLRMGNNQVVSVVIPGKFQGDVRVAFKEPWYWRTAEMIAAISTVLVIFWYYRAVKTGKRQ